MQFGATKPYGEPSDLSSPILQTVITTAPLTAAAAIQTIEKWQDLGPVKRRQLISAIHAVARVANMPPEVLVLAPPLLRSLVVQKSAAGWGIKSVTRANYLSSLREILRRFDVIDASDCELRPEWAKLWLAADRRTRMSISALARYCSARCIEPAGVTEDTLGTLEVWLTERTISATPRHIVTEAARVWNRAVGSIACWPDRKIKLKRRRVERLPLSAFPQSLQDDVARFIDRQSGGSLRDFFGLDAEAASSLDDAEEEDGTPAYGTTLRSADYGRLRETTLTSKRQLVSVALNALVRSGIRPEEVTSLADLVHPLEQAKRILHQLLKENENKTTPTIGHTTELIRQIAQHHVRLPNQAIAEIRRWSKRTRVVYNEMTVKNQRLVATMMEPANLQTLLALPSVLWAEAQALGATKRGVITARRAVLLELLIKSLPRLNNLLTIEVDTHLLRPDPRSNKITAIILPGDLMKNGRARQFPITSRMAEMLDFWMRVFRPQVAASGNRYLFPGLGQNPMTRAGLRDIIKTITKQRIGVPIHPHGFRQIGAAIFGGEFPEDGDGLSKMLGHQDLRTKEKSYVRPRDAAAHLKLDELIEAKRAMLPAKTGAKFTPKRHVKRTQSACNKQAGNTLGNKA